MSNKKTTAEITREYIRKYIELSKQNGRSYSKRFIATVLYEENPSLFKDVEHARVIVRIQTGACGVRSVKDNNLNLKEQFSIMEQGFDEIHVEPYIMPKCYKKTLVLADLHSRFCDMDCLKIAVEYGIKNKCDSVIINGDFMDFYAYSRFDKNPSIVRQFENEREWGIDVLQMLQNNFGFVVLKKGNHDKRREEKVFNLSQTVPEIEGLASYDDYLMFDGSRVKFVEDYNMIEYGKLKIIHGHEFQGGGGIHVAYNRLNKALDNVMSAHSHTAQTYTRRDINGNMFGSYSLGCLCKLNPRYNPMNNWSNGFAIIERDSDGFFEVQNKIISNGRLFNV